MKKLLIFILLLGSIHVFCQKFKNLALTPPMGWNSWNKIGCNVDEKTIRNIADAMVSSGMKDCGYKYIIIDDCWHDSIRDNQGFIRANAVRFPSGMKALADYVHSKGLKFGIYSDAGNHTCAGRPGSRGHEYQDALTYAQWGVDYLKYDWCQCDDINAKGAYTTIRDALFAAGRPVVLSLCEWGNNKPWDWASGIGHLWRTTGDIFNCFDCQKKYGSWSAWGIMKIIDMQENLRKFAGPDHWNDPDMLEVGNGMPVNEDRAHFSIWCMSAAPLISGNDLTNMSKATLDILTNKEVLAIDQDSLGIQGFRQSKTDSIEVWVKPLKRGDWALCFLNRGTKAINLEYDWKKQIIKDDVAKSELRFDQKPYAIRDLWLKKNLGMTDKTLKANIPGHDVLMLSLSR
jgi:alpha-galactosidase